jgi:hypothetical protein
MMKPLEDEQMAERLLDGLVPPQPPPELRERVLRAAQDHPANPPLPDRWTRIWENPWLRLAWAASVVLLLAGNLLLVPVQAEPQLAQADHSVDEEMAEFVRPLTIADSVTPLFGRSGGDRHELVDIDEGGNAS